MSIINAKIELTEYTWSGDFGTKVMCRWREPNIKYRWYLSNMFSSCIPSWTARTPLSHKTLKIIRTFFYINTKHRQTFKIAYVMISQHIVILQLWNEIKFHLYDKQTKFLELLQISSHIRSKENCYTHSWGPMSSDPRLSTTVLEKLSSGTNIQLIKNQHL